MIPLLPNCEVPDDGQDYERQDRDDHANSGHRLSLDCSPVLHLPSVTCGIKTGKEEFEIHCFLLASVCCFRDPKNTTDSTSLSRLTSTWPMVTLNERLRPR
jgi:hypothetical protein